MFGGLWSVCRTADQGSGIWIRDHTVSRGPGIWTRDHTVGRGPGIWTRDHTVGRGPGIWTRDHTVGRGPGIWTRGHADAGPGIMSRDHTVYRYSPTRAVSFQRLSLESVSRRVPTLPQCIHVFNRRALSNLQCIIDLCHLPSQSSIRSVLPTSVNLSCMASVCSVYLTWFIASHRVSFCSIYRLQCLPKCFICLSSAMDCSFLPT